MSDEVAPLVERLKSEDGFRLNAKAVETLLKEQEVDLSSFPAVRRCVLNANLSDVGEGYLPRDVRSAAKLTLEGKHALQVSSVENMSAAEKGRFKDDGPTNRLLRVELTDGQRKCVAVEHSPISFLSTKISPGTKVCVENAPLRTGCILLDEKCFSVLGGTVENLKVEWAVKRSLGSRVRKANPTAEGDGPPAFSLPPSNGKVPAKGKKNAAAQPKESTKTNAKQGNAKSKVKDAPNVQVTSEANDNRPNGKHGSLPQPPTQNGQQPQQQPLKKNSKQQAKETAANKQQQQQDRVQHPPQNKGQQQKDRQPKGPGSQSNNKQQQQERPQSKAQQQTPQQTPQQQQKQSQIQQQQQQQPRSQTNKQQQGNIQHQPRVRVQQETSIVRDVAHEAQQRKHAFQQGPQGNSAPRNPQQVRRQPQQDQHARRQDQVKKGGAARDDRPFSAPAGVAYKPSGTSTIIPDKSAPGSIKGGQSTQHQPASSSQDPTGQRKKKPNPDQGLLPVTNASGGGVKSRFPLVQSGPPTRFSLTACAKAMSLESNPAGNVKMKFDISDGQNTVQAVASEDLFLDIFGIRADQAKKLVNLGKTDQISRCCQSAGKMYLETQSVFSIEARHPLDKIPGTILSIAPDRFQDVTDGVKHMQVHSQMPMPSQQQPNGEGLPSSRGRGRGRGGWRGAKT